MTFTDNTEVHARTLTAMFDTRDAADRAVKDLENAGIPREHIRLHGGRTTVGTSDTTATGGESFWDSLKDLFMPEEDRHAYAEGLRRGGYLVTVEADEANYNHVLDILDQEGSVDMDERESTWRSEGWTGYQTSSGSGAALSSAGSYTETATTPAVGATGATAAGLGVAGAQSSTAASTMGKDEVIPLYEEQLKVGKRDVSHGRVRLRSYVVETPVNEQVSLHSESVQVERRPVDRVVGAGEAVFQDRVIEAEERAEEAVISKTARVTEEVSLRKTAEDQTKTVSDSVRRTEVEVDDDRTGHGLAKTTETVPGTTASPKI